MATAAATANREPRSKRTVSQPASRNGFAAHYGLAFPDGEPLTLTIPADANTLAGFRRWRASDDFPEKGHIDYLAGEVCIDMSWERLESHNQVKTESGRVLANRTPRKDLGKFYMDGAAIVNEEADIHNVPDSVFVSWESFEKNRVRKVESKRLPGDFDELEGTPDWILEIISMSSVAKDTKKLLTLYHRAGIPEYWLIDARGDVLSFQILRHQPKGYVAQHVERGWQHSPVFGAWFRLTRKKDRLGGWTYRLQVRESKKR